MLQQLNFEPIFEEIEDLDRGYNIIPFEHKRVGIIGAPFFSEFENLLKNEDKVVIVLGMNELDRTTFNQNLSEQLLDKINNEIILKSKLNEYESLYSLKQKSKYHK